MSDTVKIVSIGAVSILFIFVILLMPYNTAMLDKLFWALCAVIGIPAIANGIWRLANRAKDRRVN